MSQSADKQAKDAFRTISEVSDILETPSHVLRFWESKFTQINPVKRAGGRRYYRPSDIVLINGVKRLLHEDGLTIKGVQEIFRTEGVEHVAAYGFAQEPAEQTASVNSENLKDVYGERYLLSLGYDEIELIDVGKGLLPFASVKLGSQDLGQDLKNARMAATDGRDVPLDIAVLIPSEQILFTQFMKLAKDQAEAEKLAQSILDGATPYAIEELASDVRWQPNTPKVLIAAVAKETLGEAYAFCTEHKFHPRTFGAKPVGSRFPHHAIFEFMLPENGHNEPFSDEKEKANTAGLRARLSKNGQRLLVDDNGVLNLSGRGVVSTALDSSSQLLLVAMRRHLDQLQSEARRRQVPEEVISRFASYSIPLAQEVPMPVLLEGPMSFLRGGLEDPYITDALDGGFIKGWQQLCEMHDRLSACLDDEEASEPRMKLAENFQIEEMSEATAEIMEAMASPSVSDEVTLVLSAAKDFFDREKEVKKPRKKLVVQAVVFVASVVAFAASGAGLQSWTVSPEGQAVIQKLGPLVDRVGAFLGF